MNIIFMKKMDRWAGIPMCFLLSGIERMIRFFSSPQKRPIRRILLLKPSEMGALILAFPMIKRIKQIYPDAELFFLTFNKNKPILNLLPGIARFENVLTVRDDSFGRFVMDNIRALREVRRLNIDAVIDMEFFSRYTAIFSYLTGARIRCGFHGYNYEGLYRGNLLTHRVQYNPLLHTARSYQALGEALRQPDEPRDTPEMNLSFDDESFILPLYSSQDSVRSAVIAKLKQRGWDETKKLILVNPGEGLIELREWPLENFVSLCEKIVGLNKYQIVLTGVKGETKKDEMLQRALGMENCLNLTGETTLEELMELFYLAEILVSNDSGLAHLASLTPLPKFILFGPESPAVFSPISGKTVIFYSGIACSPCLSAFNHRNSSCRDNLCLKVITPSEVFNRIQRYFETESLSAIENIREP